MCDSVLGPLLLYSQMCLSLILTLKSCLQLWLLCAVAKLPAFAPATSCALDATPTSVITYRMLLTSQRLPPS